MQGFWKGTLLGLVNVVVIALGIGVRVGESAIVTLVVAFGVIPGVVAGGGLGILAGRLRRFSPLLRFALLAVPAIGVVFVLAYEFELRDLAAISCIPTLVAAAILERWTRPRPAPPLPVARASS